MEPTRLVDPLGRAVRFTEGAWFNHILKGHPEMAPYRASVEAAVTAPTAIHVSTSDPNCRLYYGPSHRSGFMIAVVADVGGGFVKTAYLTKRVKPGTQEWPTPPRPSRE